MIQALAGYGFVTYAWTVYVRIFIKEFGWTTTMMGALTTVGRINGMWAYPLGGGMTDRWGPRWVSMGWLTVMALGWVGVYFMTDYWQLYIFYSLLLYATVSGGLYRISYTAANRWWAQRRAMGIGIITLGGGFGGVVIIPIVAILIEAQGWHSVTLWIALLTLILCVPIGLLYPSQMPEHYGLYVDNMAPEDIQSRTSGRRVTAQFAELTTQEALRTSAFWLLTIGGSFVGLAGGAVTIFQNSRMGAVGYSTVEAAVFYAFNRTMTYVGRFGVTFFGDWFSARLQPRFILGGCYIFIGGGMLFFAIGTVDWHFYVWAVFYGVFSGVITPYLGYIFGAYFGRGAFGLIYGIRTSVAAIGSAISPLLVGYLVEMRKGDWIFPFLLVTAFYAVGAVLYAMAKPPKQPDRGEQQS